MTPVQKHRVRASLRRALKEMNQCSIFSCFNCISCVPKEGDEVGHSCYAEMLAYPSDKKISAHMMRDCFNYNYMNSPLVRVLEEMHEMGIDFHEATHGWPTVVSRMLPRLNRFGHNLNIKRHNLERIV